MNIDTQVETLGGSEGRPFGSDAYSGLIPSRALERGVEPVRLDGERLGVDWVKLAVWTAVLSSTAVLWMGVYALVVSAVALL